MVKPAKTTIADYAPIRGTVTDAQGKPVSGVSVTLKGTSTGTTTGADGKFSLDIPATGTLVISSVGYTMQEIVLNGQSEITVSLAEESQSLNTVVVTALGIRRDKKALSYSVTQVNGDDLNKAREINLGNALTGKSCGCKRYQYCNRTRRI